MGDILPVVSVLYIRAPVRFSRHCEQNTTLRCQAEIGSQSVLECCRRTDDYRARAFYVINSRSFFVEKTSPRSHGRGVPSVANGPGCRWSVSSPDQVRHILVWQILPLDFRQSLFYGIEDTFFSVVYRKRQHQVMAIVYS